VRSQITPVGQTEQ